MELNTARSMLLRRGNAKAQVAEPWPTAAPVHSIGVGAPEPHLTPFGVLWAYVRRLLH